MFDWVLNRPMVFTDNHSISLILKLKVEKKLFTRVSAKNWLTNKKVTKDTFVDLPISFYFLLLALNIL